MDSSVPTTKSKPFTARIVLGIIVVAGGTALCVWWSFDADNYLPAIGMAISGLVAGCILRKQTAWALLIPTAILWILFSLWGIWQGEYGYIAFFIIVFTTWSGAFIGWMLLVGVAQAINRQKGFWLPLVFAAVLIGLLSMVINVMWSEDEEPVVLSEKGDIYGIGIGSSARAVERVFGKPIPASEQDEDEVESGSPLKADDDVWPYSIRCNGFGKGYRYMKYDHFGFTLDSGRVCNLDVVKAGAEAGRDVGIGDKIGEVKKRYKKADCGTQRIGEIFPRDIPFCQVKLGPKRYLWIGGDPIKLLTVGVENMLAPAGVRGELK